MFNDFNDDSRSVGVAGLVLGLLVLAGFCGLGMAVMSGDAGRKDHSLSSRIADRGRIIEQLSYDLKREEERLKKAVQAREEVQIAAKMSEELAEHEGAVGKCEAFLEDLKAGLGEIEEEHGRYRSRYRLSERRTAIGEVLDLSETLGAEYKRSKIREITPIHVRVMRSSGPIGIPYQRLPVSVQDRFQFSEEEASDFREKMSHASEKRDAFHAANQQRLSEKKERSRKENLRHQIARLEAEMQAKRELADREQAAALRYKREATEHQTSADRAKASGKISSSRGKATRARKFSELHVKREIQAKLEISELREKAVELSRQLSELKR